MRDNFNNSGRGDALESGAAHQKPSLTVDVEKYQSYLDGSGMSDAEKEEFLQALWSIIVSFIELGFGVHPLQEVCGKTPEIEGQGAKAAFDGVSSEQPENNENTNDFSP